MWVHGCGMWFIWEWWNHEVRVRCEMPVEWDEENDGPLVLKKRLCNLTVSRTFIAIVDTEHYGPSKLYRNVATLPSATQHLHNGVVTLPPITQHLHHGVCQLFRCQCLPLQQSSKATSFQSLA